jgi:hypothetical protein
LMTGASTAHCMAGHAVYRYRMNMLERESSLTKRLAVSKPESSA